MDLEKEKQHPGPSATCPVLEQPGLEMATERDSPKPKLPLLGAVPLDERLRSPDGAAACLDVIFRRIWHSY